MNWSVIEWGDVATWVQAIGTVTLFVAAVVAGKIAHNVYQIERERDDKRDEERRSAQAQLVSAWVEARISSIDADGKRKIGRVVTALRNASHAPVYDVDMEFAVGESRVGTDHADTLFPTGEKVSRPIPNQWLESGTLRVAITFRDVAGRRWRRGYDGWLSALEPTDESQDSDGAPSPKPEAPFPGGRC